MFAAGVDPEASKVTVSPTYGLCGLKVKSASGTSAAAAAPITTAASKKTAAMRHPE